MLPHDSWDVLSYHQQDLLAEAESERLVAMLPERKPLRLRQALARACYRLASWLDKPSLHVLNSSGSGEPAAPRPQSLLRSRAHSALLSGATPRVRAEPPLYGVEGLDGW
ncbi:MAG TPA: hypothetical protein VGK33_01200 [Chloroflexota bacterium]|jgi:hypothetical protein